MVAKKVGLIVSILLVFSLFFAIAAPIRAPDEELIRVNSSANLSTTDIDFSFPDSLAPVAQLNKTYGESDNDHAYSIVQTNDGGYALAGDTWYGDIQSDFWLVKTDSYGNMQWNRSYGQLTCEVANSVIQASDGGYVLAGSYDSDTHGKQLRVIKTDSFGDGEWTQTLGEYGNDEANCVIQTADGKLVVAGATSKYGYYGGYYYSDFWLVKFSLTGNVEWNKTYGHAAPANDVAYSVVQTDDDGYILAGQEMVSYDYWLVKTDPYGDMEWNRTIEHPYGSSTPHSIVQTFDGGYAVVGECHTSYGDTDIWLVKTDDLGEVEWTREYGTGYNYNDNAYAVLQTSDEGYAIAGYSGYSRFLLLRIDGTGEAIYSEEYGPELSYCYAFSMVQTSDGGYAMAGYLESEYTGFDFYLVKTEPELLQHDVAVTNVVAWETAAYQGDWIDVDITVENQGAYTETFNVTLYANTTMIGRETFESWMGYSETVTWMWDTAGFAAGNYTLSATADQVPGETDTADNVCMDGIVAILPIPYYVSMKAYCLNEANSVSVDITMDGISTGYATPHIFYDLTGTHTFTVPNTDANSHSFTQWNTGSTNATLVVSSEGPTQYTAFYQSAAHDVAITNITLSKSIVCQGHDLDIAITAENQGDYAETFNLTAYANSTILSTQIVTLESKSSAPIVFTWNTAGFARGNYIISANATPVTGEEEISDNTYAFGAVTVTIEGDVDGDFDVDILDVVRITAVYASKLGDPNFNPNSDLNNDNQITILDVVICTSHYGEKWP